MEVIASACKQKIINENVYRYLAVKTTIITLESYGYQCKEKLGTGAFGDIIVVENKRKSSRVAAKIILNDFVTNSESKLWPKLKSDYILPVLGQVDFRDVPTSIFFVPECQGSVAETLKCVNALHGKKGFKVLKNWLRDIVSGLKYLHTEGMCHLDLNMNNILIKENESACICDLGCVRKADELVDSYEAPILYRPPEAQISERSQTAVNGIKFDVWTLGVLAVEMFSKEMLKETLFERTAGNIYSWPQEIYRVLFRILEENNFEIVMQRSCLKSIVSRKAMINLRNFITCCLNINPEVRPSASKLLNHKFFGGSYRYVFEVQSDNIWDEFVTPLKLQQMISTYSVEVANELPKKVPTDFCEDDHSGINMEQGKYVQSERDANDNDMNTRTSFSVEKVNNNVVDGQHLNRKQKIYRWFQRKRNKVRRFFQRMF